MPTITTHNIEYASEIANLNPFMYKGYFYDKEIKMYYLKSRYYDPDLGRFINADVVVGSVGQTMGMNLYTYCKCNPINLVDEDGNWPSLATKVCIGLAVIAVCALLTVACIATGFVQVKSIEIEHLKEELHVYNLNVLGYHTYVVGNGLLVVHNTCIKDGATEKVQYNYKGSKTSAYNTGGGKTYFALDRAGHGGSCYKGFKLIKNKKLTWIGDFDENFNLIINKHKESATMIFDVIKLIQL